MIVELLAHKGWPVWKKFIRFAISKTANMMREEIERKKKTRWVDEEIKILYDELTEVLEKNDYKDHLGGDDEMGNKKMWEDFRDVACTLLDEDTYYKIRLFHLIELIVADKDKYQNAHATSKWLEWRDTRAALLAEHQPLKKLDDPYCEKKLKDL